MFARIVAPASLLAGGIHLGAVPSHLAAWPLQAWAFLAVGLLQAGCGAAWLVTRGRGPARALVGVHVAAVATWAVTRTVGWPAGPFAGDVEPVAVADAVAATVALVALVALFLGGWQRRSRPGRGRALAAGLGLFALAASSVALVPGLAHGPDDHAHGPDEHAHGFVLPADHRPDGLDLRRRADDPTDGTAVAVGRAPVDVALGHGRLWVVNGRDGSVTRLTPAGQVVDTLPGVGEGATTIVTGHDAMWVAAAGGTVTRLAADTGTVTGVVEVGGLARGLAVGTDGTVYATTAADGRLHRIDPHDLTVASAPLQPGVLAAFDGTGPSAVAIDPGPTAGGDDDVLWVVLTLKREVRRYDARTLVPLGEPLPTGAGAADVLLDGDVAWVANTTDGTLTRLDRRTGAPLGEPVRVDARPEVGGGPAALASAFGSLWVLNNDERTVTRVDPATGAVVGVPWFLANHHAEVPRAAGIVGASDGVWATDYDGDRVVRLAP